MRPKDNVAPCPPIAEVSNVCDVIYSNIDKSELFNTIQWSNPFNKCPEIADDIASYNIYYAYPSPNTAL